MLWGVVRVTGKPPVYVGDGFIPGNPFTVEDYDSADQRANVYDFFRNFPNEIYVAAPFDPGPPSHIGALPTCPSHILEAIGFCDDED